MDELPKDVEGLFFGEGPFCPQEILEGSSLAVLVHKVDVMVALDHFDKVDDVDVILDESQGFYFVASEFG